MTDREAHLFYWSAAWKKKRAEVLRMDHWECQRCRAEGRYTRAQTVHHVKHLKDRPDLALEIYDPETGDRQLVSLCNECHNKEHPEKLVQSKPRPALTQEWW